jgi:hypothetical protein
MLSFMMGLSVVAGEGITPSDVQVMNLTSLFCSIPAVAGEGFEPTTLGYEPSKLPDCSNPLCFTYQLRESEGT